VDFKIIIIIIIWIYIYIYILQIIKLYHCGSGEVFNGAIFSYGLYKLLYFYAGKAKLQESHARKFN
jgi:hypothetical protein